MYYVNCSTTFKYYCSFKLFNMISMYNYFISMLELWLNYYYVPFKYL